MLGILLRGQQICRVALMLLLVAALGVIGGTNECSEREVLLEVIARSGNLTLAVGIGALTLAAVWPNRFSGWALPVFCSNGDKGHPKFPEIWFVYIMLGWTSLGLGSVVGSGTPAGINNPILVSFLTLSVLGVFRVACVILGANTSILIIWIGGAVTSGALLFLEITRDSSQLSGSPALPDFREISIVLLGSILTSVAIEALVCLFKALNSSNGEPSPIPQ